uniref:Uncharacterized protein n=1 Tax=Myotis myotis TaxID=51298 RepID=A0A7J7WHW5_MYOMY|nr:hypothetical protein mMyoMyo1_012155 [Myotis myotis]
MKQMKASADWRMLFHIGQLAEVSQGSPWPTSSPVQQAEVETRPSLHSPPPARCPGNRNWKDCKELVISNTLLALCLLVAHPGLALQTLEVS